MGFQNSKEVGIVFENKAIQILHKIGFSDIKSSGGIEPYDLVALRNGEIHFIEVKGRSSGSKQPKNFSISSEKLRRLNNLGEKSILFLFINDFGYSLYKLEQILNNRKTLKIGGKKIYVGIYDPSNLRENNKTYSVNLSGEILDKFKKIKKFETKNNSETIKKLIMEYNLEDANHKER